MCTATTYANDLAINLDDVQKIQLEINYIYIKACKMCPHGSRPSKMCHYMMPKRNQPQPKHLC